MNRPVMNDGAKEVDLMRKAVGMLLGIVCVLGVVSGVASAKDEVLLQDMAQLEKTYIPPLFFTNQPDKLQAARKGMLLLRSAWNGFKASYYDYRSDYANWQAYFDVV